MYTMLAEPLFDLFVEQHLSVSTEYRVGFDAMRQSSIRRCTLPHQSMVPRRQRLHLPELTFVHT